MSTFLSHFRAAFFTVIAHQLDHFSILLLFLLPSRLNSNVHQLLFANWCKHAKLCTAASQVSSYPAFYQRALASLTRNSSALRTICRSRVRQCAEGTVIHSRVSATDNPGCHQSNCAEASREASVLSPVLERMTAVSKKWRFALCRTDCLFPLPYSSIINLHVIALCFSEATCAELVCMCHVFLATNWWVMMFVHQCS